MSTNTLVGGEPLYSISKSDYEALTARLAEAERLLRECLECEIPVWDHGLLSAEVDSFLEGVADSADAGTKP